MPNKGGKRLLIQKRTSAQVLVLRRFVLNPFLDFGRERWALEQCTVLGHNVCSVKILVGQLAFTRYAMLLPDKFIRAINSLDSDYSAFGQLRMAH
jgi:hypothetical protein